MCRQKAAGKRYGEKSTPASQYHPMNAFTNGENRPLSLVDIIDLKWLLAREGVHLHVEKLQTDAAYARQLLECAAASPNAALRAAAQNITRQLLQDAP
jgi:hypothetical protein